MIMVKKPDDFIDWADNIIKTVRRKLKKHPCNMGSHIYKEYLGENAVKWKEDNRAELGVARLELRSMIVD